MKHSNKLYRLSLILFLTSIVGILIELLLIGHYENFWQVFPVGLLGIALINAVLFHFKYSRLVAGVFKMITIILMFSGLIGIGFHLHNNWEFENELHASQSLSQQLLNMITGAIPVTAPGAMIVSGLAGRLLILSKP